LASWDGALHKVRFQEMEHAAFRINLIELLNNHANTRRLFLESEGEFFGITPTKFPRESVHLLQMPDFDNNLILFLATAEFLNHPYYTELKGKIVKILNLIDNHIK
jgi:hypothetical protein